MKALLRMALTLAVGCLLSACTTTGTIAPASGAAPMSRKVVASLRFTIAEGWNVRDLRDALKRAPQLDQTLGLIDDTGVMSLLGMPGIHPEGRFLPGTYLYAPGDNDLHVLRQACEAMASTLDIAWQARSGDNILKTPEEMLVLASIVEMETALAEERSRIAGLYGRRLKMGMRLQADPTVIYGMGTRYDGDLGRSDLATDTPYNTYTRAGLPPTPIAMPGVDSLLAVARPAPGDDLYFVPAGDGTGRHLFAGTLTDHEANVREFLRRSRQGRVTRDGVDTGTQ